MCLSIGAHIVVRESHFSGLTRQVGQCMFSILTRGDHVLYSSQGHVLQTLIGGGTSHPQCLCTVACCRRAVRADWSAGGREHRAAHHLLQRHVHQHAQRLRQHPARLRRQLPVSSAPSFFSGPRALSTCTFKCKSACRQIAVKK